MESLTLDHPRIKEYFSSEGDRVSPPVAEFLYVHSRFVENNFLSQLEVLINNASEKILKLPRKTGYGIQFKLAGEKLAGLLGNVTEESAPEILSTLRTIYKLCIQINEAKN